MTPTKLLIGQIAYANRFHHDTNGAYGKEAINDQELTHLSEHALALAQAGSAFAHDRDARKRAGIRVLLPPGCRFRNERSLVEIGRWQRREIDL